MTTLMTSLGDWHGEDDVYRRTDSTGTYYYARRAGGAWHHWRSGRWQPLNGHQCEIIETNKNGGAAT